jgi:hypothetical protein
MAYSDNPTSVGRLAEFFPEATPVRLPVNISDDAGDSEPTVIEFGTSREVLFRSALGLEFGEHVHLCNSDRSLEADAFVVALQLENGQMAVAARFAHEVANWIVKP